MVAGLNNTQNKIIVIAGDSWACGEWSDNRTNGHGISHPGLSKYLSELGYLVINLGKPGGSNIHSADRVNDFLTMSTHLNISHVFVFQTEWIRNIKLEDKEFLVKDVATGYLNLKMRHISRFYYRLSEISQLSKTPIHLIGGCSDTIWLDKFSQEYPGLSVCCQSLTNLLLTGNHRIEDSVHAIMSKNSEKDIVYLKNNIDSKDLELLLDDIDKGNQRLTTWNQHKSFFWPDGVHANRTAHGILFEFLKTQIPDL
jgi:hypothetical protein